MKDLQVTHPTHRIQYMEFVNKEFIFELQHHYLCFITLEFWKDLRVNHVELRLNLVASDVVDRAHLFVEDEMLGRGWKPKGTQKQL